MAKNSSAAKRVQIAARNNRRNKNYKSSIKTIVKKITEVRISGSISSLTKYDKVQSLIAQAYSRIDKAAKKKVIHKNLAARKKSRLANMLKAQIE